jgi:hypothetical protein
LPDVVLDVVAIEMVTEIALQRAGIQEGPGVTSSKHCPKREIKYPGNGIAGL